MGFRSIAVAACLAFGACGPRKAELAKAEAIAEMRKHILATPALYGRAQYNPSSIPNLDEHIEQAIAKRNFGRMPSDAAGAKSLASNFAPAIWGAYLETPEEIGRASCRERV